MNNKLHFFIALIIFQIIVVSFLTKKIYKSSKNVLSTTTVNSIKKKSLVFEPTQSLKYYYEPKSNSIDKVNEWSPYQGTYTINSNSLNERFDYPIEKQEKTYRIVTLGDSFTYGLYVDTKDNWVEKLEDIFNDKLNCQNFDKFEVINLAVQGYDLLYSVQRYKIRGQKYNPDLILWLVIDPKRMNELFFPLIPKYENENNKNSYEAWSQAMYEIYNNMTDDQIYKYQLSSLDSLNMYYKGKLILLMENSSNNWPMNLKKIFSNFSTSRNNILIFNKITDTINIEKYHFPTDPHPNQKGHKQIAEDVFDYLMKNKIIPCN